MPPIAKPTTPNARHLYKVFVSSTYLDNKERRQIVQDAITTANMVWHGMEIFTASTRKTVEECRRFAEEADVLVGIIAWRYGWEPYGEEKSITEMEYDAAGERLVFLLDRDLPLNPEKDFDPGPDRWKKQEKLAAFINRFSKDQLSACFSETSLGQKVLDSHNKWREQRESQPEAEMPPPTPKPVLPSDTGLATQIKHLRII